MSPPRELGTPELELLDFGELLQPASTRNGANRCSQKLNFRDTLAYSLSFDTEMHSKRNGFALQASRSNTCMVREPLV